MIRLFTCYFVDELAVDIQARDPRLAMALW
jgi:hypothetical protein